jgi:hypothetical protein
MATSAMTVVEKSASGREVRAAAADRRCWRRSMFGGAVGRASGGP